MPAWLHARAEHIQAKNPSMPESEAFAIATQQSHALGKTPKGYGTAKGKRVAKAKYDTPEDDVKTAFAERMLPGTERYYSERMLSVLQGMAPRVWTPEGGEIDKLAQVSFPVGHPGASLFSTNKPALLPRKPGLPARPPVGAAPKPDVSRGALSAGAQIAPQPIAPRPGPLDFSGKIAMLLKLAAAEHEHAKKKEKSTGRQVAEGAGVGAAGMAGGAAGAAGLGHLAASTVRSGGHGSGYAKGALGMVGGLAGLPLGAGLGAGAAAGALKAQEAEESMAEGALRGGGGAGIGALLGAAGGAGLGFMLPPGRYPGLGAGLGAAGALTGGLAGYNLATNGIGKDKVGSMLNELEKISTEKDSGFMDAVSNIGSKIKNVAMSDVGGPKGILQPAGQAAAGAAVKGTNASRGSFQNFSKKYEGAQVAAGR